MDKKISKSELIAMFEKDGWEVVDDTVHLSFGEWPRVGDKVYYITTPLFKVDSFTMGVSTKKERPYWYHMLEISGNMFTGHYTAQRHIDALEAWLTFCSCADFDLHSHDFMFIPTYVGGKIEPLEIDAAQGLAIPLPCFSSPEAMQDAIRRTDEEKLINYMWWFFERQLQIAGSVMY